MTIAVTGPGGSISAFPDGTPTSMQAALAKVYGGPQTAGSALAQLGDPGPPQPSPATTGGQPALSPQAQPDPAASLPDTAFAALPPGGGYAPIADAAAAAAGPWLNALASDPSPVWNQRLGLLGHARALREAAAAMAGSMLDAGDSPAMAGLAFDPDSGAWTLPGTLGPLTGPGPAPTAATWLGLYHTLPKLLETDPWTGQPLSDADSPRNANIATIAGQLSSAFIGDPWTGQGGAIPGYGQVQSVFGDPFSIRAAHDAMDGTLFAKNPDGFNAAWAKASTPAEQAAARAAVSGEIADRVQNGQVLPGQLGAPDAQSRLATTFGLGAARNIAAQAEGLLASRYAPSADDQGPSIPAVTAPPPPALATAAQPFVPTTPIAASLLQSFDPGGIASALVPG
ncbi:MAG TPA: hypothetical protein VHZ26_01055 [Caulobacteraceae bacterium]|jgi:hypothetical protein|nr:hypothetical protein [Caulobacteraceae bacterium]